MLFLLAALLQQTPAPTPVASVVVRPADAAITVGDTDPPGGRGVRFGRATRSATSASAGSSREGTSRGTVDSTGLATAGAVGALRVTALVSPAGGGKSRPGFATITIVPGPAASIALAPAPRRMYVGQSVAVDATVSSAAGDQRHDPVAWSSDQPGVLGVVEHAAS